MKKLLFTLLFLLIPLTSAYAWQGKIIAVNNSNSFVILKDNSPVTVTLNGVKEFANPIEGQFKASGLALMKNVEVEETGKTASGEILANINLDGKSLAKAIMNTEDVFSTDNSSPSVDTTASTGEINSNNSKFELADKIDSAQLEQQLNAPVAENNMKAQPRQKAIHKKRYQTAMSQDTSLGLWPTKPAPQEDRYISKTSPEYETAGNNSGLYMLSQPVENQNNQSERRTTAKPITSGAIALNESNQAIKSQKHFRQKNGFLKPKKRDEIFIGAGAGPQLTTHESSRVPYSNLGTMGGISYKHFFPSGIGFGSDFTIAGTSGKDGQIGNATNGTSYDYKSKSFMNYTLTASLLYRFYSDPNFIPYVGIHGGYTLFSSPKTIFNLSNGAPVVGGGVGFLYKFDSGFTLGLDTRYLKTLGTTKDDPSGQLNSMFSAGYTFN